MRCPMCQSHNLTFTVNLMISAPIYYFHNITKKAFKSKDVQIWGADWQKTSIHCMDCHWDSHDGVLNHVKAESEK